MALPAPRDLIRMPDSATPRILFEDPHLIVLEKPPGLLSQADHSGDPDLVSWLRGYVGRNYVGLIHRLDRNTSGLMVVAKRSKAAARLTDALQKGALTRIYNVWLSGTISKSDTWRHFIIKDSRQNQVREAKSNDSRAWEAVLHLEPLGAGVWKTRKVTLCRIRLETGRPHQIRIQASLQAHAVLGDVKYGPAKDLVWNRSFGRPAIHSTELSFPHPMSEEICCYKSVLPDDMRRPLMQ